MTVHVDVPYRKPIEHSELTQLRTPKTGREVMYETYCQCLDFFSDKWTKNTGPDPAIHSLPPLTAAPRRASLTTMWLGKYV